MYYLQSRCYDAQTGRFVNGDVVEIALLGVDFPIEHNYFVYCQNNPTNDLDLSGFVSLNKIFSKIKDFLNKTINKIKSFISNNIYTYEKKSRLLSLKTSTIALAIDLAIALLVRKIIYDTLKNSMSLLLRAPAVRKTFINTLFNFFLYDTLGKWVLWFLVQIGFIIAGKPGIIGTVASNAFSRYLEKIISAKNVVLGKAYGLISSFSSIGGIIGLFLDIMDANLDGWFRVKV